MRIVGHGIDLVETQRIERMWTQHRGRFLDRCFTAAEQDYCCPATDDSKRDPNIHGRSITGTCTRLAGRFAAKEAVLKVLGTGWSSGIGWTDVEVIRLASGQPQVVVHEQAKRIAQGMGIELWWLSISHIHTHAIASAIGVAD